MGAEPLLEVEDLRVEFHTRGEVVRAVDGLSYSLSEGETLAIVGESGSGKSVSALAVLGVLDSPPARVTHGVIRYRGTDLLALPEPARRKIVGSRVSIVFQDALRALNPVHTVGAQIGEMYRAHLGLSRAEAKQRAIELMERVRIPSAARRADSYPHQFSGGMRQRVMIAIALALQPDVLIADEPTTALDVTVQAQIMRLLRELQEERSMGLVLITHDLGVVAEVADRIVVMYAGRAVEEAPATSLYSSPGHPYTRGLLASLPRLDRAGPVPQPIPGSPPDLAATPLGCAFHPRCPLAANTCRSDRPELRTVAAGHTAACHFSEEVLSG